MRIYGFTEKEMTTEKAVSSGGGCAGTTVLIAPTWGRNGSLRRFGTSILNLLLDAGFKVIVRPHPQQLKSEKPLIEKLIRHLRGISGVEWDMASSGHKSMIAADIMVSDFSGVIFDFAFIYEKPVVSIDFPFESAGLEHEDLKTDIWEVEIRENLGR